MLPALPIEEILEGDRPLPAGRTVGRSREGRAVVGFTLGRGPLAVSLIGGCHADEPVGPAMLSRLVGHLAAQGDDHPLLAAVSWRIVPHVNPDGAAANRGWSGATLPARDHRGGADLVYDPALYVRRAVREAPGDDVEFGFPRGPDDAGARPENRAVAAFLEGGAPYALHGSFHGMGFATGPWFLLEPAWVDRTRRLRRDLRDLVRRMGYRPFDVDRGGEKGFRRIDEGFSTRPDSAAMRRHFLEHGDPETAALFRPSSMEHVRSLGGDPLTLVSEMPLFLLPEEAEEEAEGKEGDGKAAFPRPVGTAGRLAFQQWLRRRTDGTKGHEALGVVESHGIFPLPVRDQMRLQLAFLAAGLAAVRGGGGGGEGQRRA